MRRQGTRSCAVGKVPTIGRWRRVPAVVALTVATVGSVAACSSGDSAPDPAPSASRSALPARYSGLADACPTFSSTQAKQFAAQGPGRPGGPSPAAGVPGVTTIDCQWAPGDARPSVSTSISIFPNGFPPADDGAGNAKRFFQGLRTAADEDASDASAHVAVAEQESRAGPAFLAAYAGTGTVTRSTLVDNAVVTVIVRDRDQVSQDLDARADDLLRRVGPAAEVLTGEAAKSLR